MLIDWKNWKFQPAWRSWKKPSKSPGEYKTRPLPPSTPPRKRRHIRTIACQMTLCASFKKTYHLVLWLSSCKRSCSLVYSVVCICWVDTWRGPSSLLPRICTEDSTWFLRQHNTHLSANSSICLNKVEGRKMTMIFKGISTLNGTRTERERIWKRNENGTRTNLEKERERNETEFGKGKKNGTRTERERFFHKQAHIENVVNFAYLRNPRDFKVQYLWVWKMLHRWL